MFNTLAQYFLGTSSNSNTLDPGAKTNHQEVPTNDHGHHSNVDQALAQQTVFQVYPNKRGRARRNRKNKANNPTQKGQRNGSAGRNNNSSSNNNPTISAVEDLLEDCTSPDFLLHGITTRICEDEDEWLFVECKASKKSGIISLHDDLLDEDLTCLPDGGVQGYEPVKPRFEIKHNPLNLNQQQLKRQLRQQNASLISCEDIEDDEELMRAVAADSKQVTDEIQVIDPAQSAVVEGNSVDVEVPSVAVELPAESAAQQQQQQAHGDEEPSDLCKAAASEPVAIKQKATQRMEESWFVTPPSCFTSQGPVHMETSPMENLLIEHPSMSVYHNTRSMEQSANIEESLVVLEKEHQQEVKMDQQHQEESVTEEQEEETGNTVVTVITAATVERTPVHNHDKKMRQKLCRNAMTRSNKTCEMNATKNGPKKRSEKQHAKNQSRANNNRKC